MNGGPLAVGEQGKEALNEGEDAAGLRGGSESKLGGVVHGGELGQTQPGANGVQPEVAGNVFRLKVVEVLSEQNITP